VQPVFTNPLNYIASFFRHEPVVFHAGLIPSSYKSAEELGIHPLEHFYLAKFIYHGKMNNFDGLKNHKFDMTSYFMDGKAVQYHLGPDLAHKCGTAGCIAGTMDGYALLDNIDLSIIVGNMPRTSGSHYNSSCTYSRKMVSLFLGRTDIGAFREGNFADRDLYKISYKEAVHVAEQFMITGDVVWPKDDKPQD
jgi:hypothetical protein